MPVAAGILTACLALSVGLLSPKIDSTSLYKTEDAKPEALAKSPDEESLKRALEARLKTLVDDGANVDGANQEAATKTLKRKDLQNWIDDYLCPVIGWDTNEAQIRMLVWDGVGDCTTPERWTARIPALSFFGLWGGLAVLILVAALTITAWMLTFSFHHTRSAYRWLYRSRVF